MREELAVRDLLAQYTYAHDLGDVEQVMRFYTDDCVITKPRGRLSGKDEVRAYYEEAHRKARRFYLWSNVIARLSDDLQEGSYFHTVVAPSGGSPRSTRGMVADRVVKRAGEWQICEHSVTIDVTTAVGPFGE